MRHREDQEEKHYHWLWAMSVTKEGKVEATVALVSKQNVRIKGPVCKIWIQLYG